MLENDTTSTRQRSDGAPPADIFLSPRVIDREAFNDYSGSLRRLIEEAAHQAEALKAAAAEAMQAQTSLRETAARHQGRADNVTRALAAIDQRLAEADRLAQQAEATRRGIETASADAQSSIESASTQAQSSLTARSEELAARLDAAAVAATETVRRAEHGSTEAVMNLVSSAERKLTLVETRLIEFKPRTEPAAAPPPPSQPVPTIDTSRLQQLLTLLNAEREKAEARTAQLKAMCDQAERSRTLLTEALAAATAQANAATGSAKAVTAQTEVVVMRLARVIDALPV